MKNFSAVLLVFFTCACELIVDVHVPFEGERLVVNSFICPDSLWSASVSLNRFILTNDIYPHKGVENATVTVHDENGPVATLYRVASGLYRSQTEKPQSGKQYTIHVSAPNYNAVEAKSMIPTAPTITSVEFEETVKDNQPNVIAKIKFTDNGETKDFYHVRLEVIFQHYDNNNGIVISRMQPENIISDNPDLNSQFISADAGLLMKDVLFNGEQTEVRVKPQNGGNLSFGAGIRVVLRSVNEDYYTYQATKKLQDEASGNPFAQPVNVYNNISNGFGIFAGLSNSTFEYYDQQPVVTGISPSSGKVGDIITITGQNFKPSSFFPFVGFQGTNGQILPARLMEVTDTQIKLEVPVGANSGKLLVNVAGNITLSDIEFQVTN